MLFEILRDNIQILNSLEKERKEKKLEKRNTKKDGNEWRSRKEMQATKERKKEGHVKGKMKKN